MKKGNGRSRAGGGGGKRSAVGEEDGGKRISLTAVPTHAAGILTPEDLHAAVAGRTLMGSPSDCCAVEEPRNTSAPEPDGSFEKPNSTHGVNLQDRRPSSETLSTQLILRFEPAWNSYIYYSLEQTHQRPGC